MWFVVSFLCLVAAAQGDIYDRQWDEFEPKQPDPCLYPYLWGQNCIEQYGSAPTMWKRQADQAPVVEMPPPPPPPPPPNTERLTIPPFGRPRPPFGPIGPFWPYPPFDPTGEWLKVAPPTTEGITPESQLSPIPVFEENSLQPPPNVRIGIGALVRRALKRFLDRVIRPLLERIMNVVLTKVCARLDSGDRIRLTQAIGEAIREVLNI